MDPFKLTVTSKYAIPFEVSLFDLDFYHKKPEAITIECNTQPYLDMLLELIRNPQKLKGLSVTASTFNQILKGEFYCGMTDNFYHTIYNAFPIHDYVPASDFRWPIVIDDFQWDIDVFSWIKCTIQPGETIEFDFHNVQPWRKTKPVSFPNPLATQVHMLDPALSVRNLKSPNPLNSGGPPQQVLIVKTTQGSSHNPETKTQP